MAVSAEYRSFVAELLVGLGPVTIRSMFGGAGVFLDGAMFGLIADETLYFKVSDSNREQYEAEGSEPFTYHGKDKPMTLQYWCVPERLYDEPEELVDWARQSFDLALKTKAQKSAKTKRNDTKSAGKKRAH